jgi:hypothetical protein
MLNRTDNPLLAPPVARDPGKPGAGRNVEQELLSRPHLDGDRRFVRRNHKANLRDARQAKTAAEAIGQLPAPDESVHLVISGRFALWDMVPGLLKMTAATIDALHLVTLGFSKRNVSALCDLVDVGAIGKAWLLCSHYFSKTSAPTYDFAAEQLAKRPDRMSFLSVRTHAKLVVIALGDGRRFTIESSANLRSCKNIEQASLFGCPALYDFHRAWIDELFARGTR